MKSIRAARQIVAIILAATIAAARLPCCQHRVSTAPPASGAAGGNPGAQKWRFATGGSVATPAIGADGTIYVGSSDFNLYAVAPNGTRKWVFKTDNGVGSPAVSADGTIYVSAGDNL